MGLRVQGKIKGLFKTKPWTPVEMVQYLNELLLFVLGNTETREKKRAEKARQNVTHVIANLQKQKVNSKVITSNYLGNNLDIMDTMLPCYEDGDIAWTYGSILRECIRHQNVARYVLESYHMKKFFQYLQNPNFDIASDVQATFKELLTRYKSTVAEFLSANYNWFFHEYNTKLLQSESYITRRLAVKLMLLALIEKKNGLYRPYNQCYLRFETPKCALLTATVYKTPIRDSPIDLEVPVGEDQKQYLELTRELAERED
ncbi:putative Auxin-responsive family protein [Hibiscus syriacus]|uniref:Auxin-responsive family protein n=1 Tax=Hibiscus syriacus TaxID=106335 RepID=A0A6A2Y0U3_HIBSY|nr:putative Auxin-responsive family protein [Hibiscus syriacus]